MSTVNNARKGVPKCMHSPCKGYTMFLRWHPFKPDWEVRRCIKCHGLTAQDSRR